MKKIIPFLIMAVFVFATAGCGTAFESGVYKSTDGGKTWQHLVSKDEGTTLLPPMDVTALVSDQVFTDTLYVGSKNKGVYKTIDGGKTWQAINNGLPKDGKGLKVTALAINQLSGRTVYLACMLDKYGRIFKSEDGGTSWKEIYAESEKNSRINALLTSAKEPGVLYLGTDKGGILKSTTYGESFTALKWLDRVAVTSLAIDPRDSKIIYAGTDNLMGVLKSTDGGKTWNETGAKNQDNVYQQSRKDFFINCITVDPKNNKTVYAGTDQGIYVSRDQGTNWELVNTLMPPKSGGVFSIAVGPQYGTIYFSTEKILYKSINKGETWETSKLETPGHVRFVIADPFNVNLIYLGVGSLDKAKKGPLF